MTYTTTPLKELTATSDQLHLTSMTIGIDRNNGKNNYGKSSLG